MFLRLTITCLGMILLVIGGDATISHAQAVAYVHATIETLGPEGKIENGTLVVRGNTIVDIGDAVEIPNDARVISLSGMTIMPGIVDPYFVFPVVSASGAAPAARTIVIRGRTITIGGSAPTSSGAFVQIGKYFYPYNFDFKPSIRSGISVANLVSSGRGLSAFANLQVEPTPEMLFQTKGVLFASLTNQTSSLDVIRKPLAAKAKTTGSSDSSTLKRPAESSKISTTNKSSTAAKADPSKKAWETVREGKASLFVNLNNSASVAHVLKIVKKYPDVRWVLVATGGNLYPSLDALAKLDNITVVLQPGIDTVPFTSELMNVSRLLFEKKIPFAISMSLSKSQMASMQDDPMFPVAMLVKTGLDRETALKSITIEPATLLGIEKSHGTLEKNKRANFLVFDGDPLMTGSRLKQVILNGKKIDEN